MGDLELLDFERVWPRHTGAKENALYDLGLTPARYYQRLHRVADSINGQAHDPITARMVRDQRVAAIRRREAAASQIRLTCRST